jgi:DNA-binding transcriptional LysR family regulator
MDRLEAMRILVAVVESGGFSAASRRLGLTLPTVSRKVAELETHLGCRLLTRSTRKLELTAPGRDYLAACKRILEQVGEAERQALGEYASPRGELSLTAPVVFGRLHVVPVVCDFLARHPKIDARLIQSDRNLHLLEDHIDAAVRIGVLPDSTLIALPLGFVRRIVCGSPTYFAAHGVPKTPADLGRLDAITFDALGSASTWAFAGEGSARAEAVRVRTRLRTNTAEAALDAAIAGGGVTQVLSYQASAALAEGRLRIVLRDFETAPLPVNLLYPAQGPLPLKTRAFFDFSVPRLRGRLASDLPA